MKVEIVKPEDRKETACTCYLCKNMCKQSPCFPTPSDVKKLIQAGFKDDLASTLYKSPFTGYNYPLIAPFGLEGKGCIFQDKTGLCKLHSLGLKPTEGKLAIHNQENNGLREWICEKWFTKEGIEAFELFLELKVTK